VHIALWAAVSLSACGGGTQSAVGSGKPGDCASTRADAEKAWAKEKSKLVQLRDLENEETTSRGSEAPSRELIRSLDSTIDEIEAARAATAGAPPDAGKKGQSALKAYDAFSHNFVKHLRARHAEAFPELNESYESDRREGRRSIEEAAHLSASLADVCH
jgi:hypothetical protein